MEKKLKQIEKLLLEVFDEINEDIRCRNLTVSSWGGHSVEWQLWNGYIHAGNSNGSVFLTVDDVLALVKSPERKILFRKFSKVS